MGLNALNPGSCNFPGVGSFYDPVLDQPADGANPFGDPPAEPVLPLPRKSPPSLTRLPWPNSSRICRITRTRSRDPGRFQGSWRLPGKGRTRSESMPQPYQKALADWEIRRNTAVSKAESLINRFHETSAGPSMDKDDSGAFGAKMVTAWGVQA